MEEGDYKVWPGNWRLPASMSREDVIRWWGRLLRVNRVFLADPFAPSDSHAEWRKLNGEADGERE